jgi:protein SCO1/2
VDVLGPVTLTDHRQQPVSLPDGRVWVVTFFYGHCKDVCPTLLYNLGSVAEAMPEAARKNVKFAAVTFDPARDTVASLADQAENFELTAGYYHLLTGEPAGLQPVFKSFKFDYKADRDGGFNHTNLIAIMDGQGRILHHFYGLQPNVARIAELAQEAARH